MACVVLTARAPVTNLSLVLVRGGVVTGRITSVEGLPAVNRTVEAIPVGGQQANASARSDDRGEYRIFGLTPGRYHIQSTFYNTVGAMPNAQGEFGKTFFPGAIDASGAVPLEVVLGKEYRSIDFAESHSAAGTIAPGSDLSAQKFVLSGTLRISGLPNRMSSVGWQLVPDEAVFDIRRLSSDFYRVTNSAAGVANGQFEIKGIRSGKYHLSAALSDGVRRRIAWIPVTVSDMNLTGLSLQLDPALDVRGHVSVSPNARVAVPANGLRVSLAPAGVPNIMATMVGHVSIVPDAKGNFSATNIPPGRYAISALNGITSLAVVDVRSGTQSILDRQTVVLGSQTQTLEIGLGETGSISGRVPNVLQSSTVTAVLIPEASSNEDRTHTAVASRFGSFRLSGLPPGNYLLSVWTGLAPESLKDSMFMSDAKSLGQRIGVTAGSSLSVQYEASSETGTTPQRLTPTRSADTEEPGIEGRVWKEQSPAVNSTVLLLPLVEGEVLSAEVVSKIRSTTTTGNGYFVFRDLPPGPYRIYAFDKLVEPQMRNEELFGRYGSLSKEVVMNALVQTSIELKLIETDQGR
jgi:hypothetical protein